MKKKAMDNYKSKFPEKQLAKNKSFRIDRLSDHLHHWSYNEEHYKDIIHISEKDHNRLHRFLTYDQEHFMYRVAVDNETFRQGELLDSKNRHLKFLEWTKTQPY
jgi:hypothetical protein